MSTSTKSSLPTQTPSISSSGFDEFLYYCHSTNIEKVREILKSNPPNADYYKAMRYAIIAHSNDLLQVLISHIHSSLTAAKVKDILCASISCSITANSKECFNTIFSQECIYKSRKKDTVVKKYIKNWFTDIAAIDDLFYLKSIINLSCADELDYKDVFKLVLKEMTYNPKYELLNYLILNYDIAAQDLPENKNIFSMAEKFHNDLRVQIEKKQEILSQLSALSSITPQASQGLKETLVKMKKI